MLLPVFLVVTAAVLGQARVLIPFAATHYGIKCHRVPAQPFEPVDCTGLLQTLRTTPWANAPLTYGRLEPPPGKIPILLDGDSCRFELHSLGPRSTVTDTFQLSDYFSALDKIRDDCLGPAGRARGYTMGTTVVGDKGEFFAYLGAVPTAFLGAGTGTSRTSILVDA